MAGALRAKRGLGSEQPRQLLPPTIAGSAVGNLNDTILKPNVNYSVTAEVTARCVTPSVDLN